MTAGSQTVTVSDLAGSLKSGSTSSITVAPGAVSQFSVTASASSTTAGTSLNFTVTAQDAGNNAVSSYSGTVHFTSTDPQAVLPPDSTLTNGTGAFSVKLDTAGSQTVTATDKASTSLTGTSSGIAVSAGPAATLSVQAPVAVTTGIAFSVAVKALDTFSNVATSYTGTVHFTSNDSQAVLPANSTLTSGAGSFSVTLKTIASNETVTATDTVTASITGVTSAINVVTNAATHLSLTAPANSSTRQTFSLTVTALDAANNTSTVYSGTVHFSSTDAQAMLPANSTLTAGTASFSATFETAGTQTITATDTVTASITGAGSISVAASAALVISSGTPQNGTVGVTYGAVHTLHYQCVWNTFLRRYTCTPCIPGVSCGSYPPCPLFGRGASPCIKTTTTFVGFKFTATGGVPSYTWSASGLPPGLTVDAPTGEILGTPTSPGNFNLTVTVTDSGNPTVQTTANYALTMAPPPPPVVNATPAPPPGVINQPYSFSFTATGYQPSTFTWSESGPLPNGLAFNNSTGVLSGTSTVTGPFPITVTATDQFNQSSPAANFTITINAHGFVPTGSMSTTRQEHAATLLGTGKVLVSGGIDNSSNRLGSAELFDPSTGSFSLTGAMQTPHAGHTSTLLNTGKALIVGGQIDNTGAVTGAAELYDPAAGTFSSTGSMQLARSGHTATLLTSGKVLIVGGQGSAGNPAALSSAELYDPSTGLFTPAGSLQTPRSGHTATLLASGKVLIAGGIDATSAVLNTAELYDPGAGTFTTVVGKMSAVRTAHTANLLSSSGKVLLAGGFDGTGVGQNTAELFDPTSQSFTATNKMVNGHAEQTATTLNDGTVLLAGGADASGVITGAEIFDPNTGNFTSTGSLITGRRFHTATLLNDGTVLATGGIDISGSCLLSAEIYH